MATSLIGRSLALAVNVVSDESARKVDSGMNRAIEVYASIEGEFPTDDYVKKYLNLVAICERLGFSGSLVQFNHRVPDPWLISSIVIQNSSKFVPMIAVQPYYSSPLAVAKMVATIGYVYRRRVALNMVIGSTPGELHQVQDTLDHDTRFKRMDEYLEILGRLLANETPLDYSGETYDYNQLSYFAAEMEAAFSPKIFIAGSSDAAKDLSIRHNAVAVTNPQPIGHFSSDFAGPLEGKAEMGVRIGLIARDTRAEARAAARLYFPSSRAAQIGVKLNGRASDSVWRRELADLADQETHDDVFWLGAILAGGSHSPFLVGSYEEVASYLARYIDCGVSNIILASPWDEYHSNSKILQMVGEDFSVK
ncbi:alkanesulfonate monooxygenase [Streptomyces umbrinus]|uniref:Alkanesulfonate monooxygenase n=1 Tax=Streptomyces umbrinus TaxID=67370 RepID=A0ABU0SME9_9ACTN|nr:LLM class flavin-dependent oxidoreductase [Streptomyces umbrinus]MDQ1024740.1 alkanesulfonate monooxygenase [Streptomyces umbrinus]